MTEAKTTSLGKLGHPEMVVNISAEYAGSLEWLFSYFESAIQNGSVFKSGQTVQIGWMVVKLFAREDGAIELWEPTFDQMPIKWCFELNRTLRDVMVQSEVCKKLKLEPIFPSILDPGLFSDALTVDKFAFTMSRDTRSESDCGWAFLENDAIDLSTRYRSLFEIAVFKPSIIPFLAIPPICSVKFDHQGFVVAYKGRTVSSNDIEFLQSLRSSWYFDQMPRQLN